MPKTYSLSDEIQIRHSHCGYGVFTEDGLEHIKTIPETIVAQCIAGAYEVWAEGQHAYIKPGEFFCLAPMRTIRIVHHAAGAEPMRARWLMFQAQRYGHLDIFADYRLPLHISVEQSTRFIQAFDALHKFDDAGDVDLLGTLRYQASVFTVMADLIESSEQINQQHAELSRLAPVYRYIEEHLSEVISVADLAACLHLSEARFFVLFKEITKTTPKAWLQRVRLERVAHQLLNDDVGLEQIACDNGFANAFHLSRLFKQWSGLAPSMWRREHRQQLL